MSARTRRVAHLCEACEDPKYCVAGPSTQKGRSLATEIYLRRIRSGWRASNDFDSDRRDCPVIHIGPGDECRVGSLLHNRYYLCSRHLGTTTMKAVSRVDVDGCSRLVPLVRDGTPSPRPML